MSEERPDRTIERIPHNRGNTQRIGGFRKRNLWEGIIETVIALVFVMVIPFVSNLKLALGVILIMIIMFANLIGIRGKSLTENFILWINYRVSRRSMKLRSVNEKDGNSRFKQPKYSEKTRKVFAYFEDDNLNRDDGDARRIIAKTVKGMFFNIKDNFDL